jgi:hypothetical protein
MNNQPDQQDRSEGSVTRDGAAIVGQTEGPLRSDDTTADYTAKDNLHTEAQENSANGLDSVEVRGGQDGRNNRGMGSQDMDSANGVLRFNDQDDTTMQVTEAAKTSIAASDAQTNTGPAAVTTAGQEPGRPTVPNAQRSASQKEDTDETPRTDEADEPSDESDEKEMARTGTNLDFQPAA